MILTFHSWAPDPEGPHSWVAGIQELDGIFAEGATEPQAIAACQAAALEHLAQELRTGARGPLDIFESVVFLPYEEWSRGL